jgi:predicted GIY-YIG superfamily endonuclease
MSGVYLLHFSQSFSHARHYIGWAKDKDKRIEHHRGGTGAKLTQAVVAKGIELIEARFWEGNDKNFERRLKNYKKTSLLCPICSGTKAESRMK